eukprot:m51a1_g9883 hypothetical protein (136) ;mRNA; r:18385-18792
MAGQRTVLDFAELNNCVFSAGGPRCCSNLVAAVLGRRDCYGNVQRLEGYEVAAFVAALVHAKKKTGPPTRTGGRMAFQAQDPQVLLAIQTFRLLAVGKLTEEQDGMLRAIETPPTEEQEKTPRAIETKGASLNSN